MDTLLFVDSYLSDLDRASACKNLITQIREFFPNYKIALLNKYPKSYELESEVDYYFYYGDGILVGPPPQKWVEEQSYEVSYVYTQVGKHTIENWMPLVGVTDHVSSILDSFILSSRIAESLGFKKVFKFEYDTILDPLESKSILNDLPKFQDYLIYGKRHQGQWKKDHHYEIDVHIIGYSTKVFQDLKLNKSDDVFWELCETVDYKGKWIEYIIPSIIEYQRPKFNLIGTSYPGEVKDLYPNTQFDIINSPSYWTEKWENMPKVCRVSYDKGASENKNKYGLFFWNDQESPLEIDYKIYNSSGEVILEDHHILGHTQWIWKVFDFDEELTLKTTNIRNGLEKYYETSFTPDNIINQKVRMLYEG